MGKAKWGAKRSKTRQVCGRGFCSTSSNTRGRDEDHNIDDEKNDVCRRSVLGKR